MQGRILIVEPDDAIREMLRVALRRTGHDVAAMDTGDEAIAAMEREHFSCVLVGSPVTVESNGARLLFLEYIERHCPRWRPCIIVVTTHVEPGPVIATVERLAVCAVLAKPFAAADLLDVVGGCLAGRHTPTRWIGVPEISRSAVAAKPNAAAPDPSP